MSRLVWELKKTGLATRNSYEADLFIEASDALKIAVTALRQIVACDYRGNKPPEQEIADNALKALNEEPL